MKNKSTFYRILEIVLLLSAIAFVIGAILFATISETSTNLLKNILIISSVAYLVITGLIATRIEQKVGAYQCPTCKRYNFPGYFEVMFSFHIEYDRYLKCPYCKSRGLHTKIWK